MECVVAFFNVADDIKIKMILIQKANTEQDHWDHI